MVLLWVTICTLHILGGNKRATRREGERGEEETRGGRIVTPAGALVCHLSLRQPIREIRGGGEGETEKRRGGGSQRGEGFLEAQWSVDVSLSS